MVCLFLYENYVIFIWRFKMYKKNGKNVLCVIGVEPKNIEDSIKVFQIDKLIV